MIEIKNAKRIYYIVIPPLKLRAKYLGDIRDEYSKFLSLILNYFELIRMNIDERSDKNIASEENDIIEKIKKRDLYNKEKSSELILYELDAKSIDDKKPLILILFIKSPQIMEKEGVREDLFMSCFQSSIDKIKQNKTKIKEFRILNINNLSLIEKDASYNIDKIKIKEKEDDKIEEENEEEEEKKKKKKEKKEEIFRFKPNKRGDKIESEHDFEDVIKPYAMMHLQEKYKNKEVVDDECFLNVLDINTFKDLFSYKNTIKLLYRLGYTGFDENEILFVENTDDGKKINQLIKLDEKKAFDLNIDGLFSVIRYKNTIIPFENSEKQKLVNDLLDCLENKEEGQIINGFDSYMHRVLKTEKKNEDNKECYGDVFLMMKRHLMPLYNSLNIGNGLIANKNFGEYSKRLQKFKSDGLKKVKLFNKVNEDLDRFYSCVVKDIIKWIDNNRTDEKGNRRHFQYKKMIKKENDEEISYYIPFTLYFFDEKFDVMTNYLLYNHICLENVNKLSGNFGVYHLLEISLNNQFLAEHSLKFCPYLYGPGQVGKTYLAQIKEKNSIEGTCSVEIQGSRRANEKLVNENYLIKINNEAENAVNGKPLDIDIQNEYKALATDMKITREIKILVDGKWITYKLRIDLFQIGWRNSNFKIIDKAIESRNCLFYINPPNESEVENKMAASSLQKTINPEFPRFLSEIKKDIQCLSYEIHKGINCGIIQKPTIIMSEFLFQYIVSELKSRGVSMNVGPRNYERFYISITEFTIVKAILEVFAIPGGPGYRQLYTDELLFEVERRMSSTFSITVQVLMLNYETLFEDKFTKNIIKHIYDHVFQIKTAIKQYESNIMHIEKDGNKPEYIYKNSSRFEEDYEDDSNENTEKYDKSDNVYKKNVRKTFIFKPWVNYKQNEFKRTEINFTYHLFAILNYFKKNKDYNLNFREIVKGDKNPKTYYDLNYISITVQDLSSFVKILMNAEGNPTQKEIYSFINNLKTKKIEPVCILKYIEKEGFEAAQDALELLYNDEKHGTKGKTRQELDDRLREFDNFKPGKIFKFINTESNDRKKRMFTIDGPVYDKNGMECCKIEQMRVKMIDERNNTKIVTEERISFLVSLFRFDPIKEIKKVLTDFSYEGFKPRKLPLVIPTTKTNCFPVIEIKESKNKTTTIKNHYYINEVNEKIITDTFSSKFNFKNVSKDDEIEDFIETKKIKDELIIEEEEYENDKEKNFLTIFGEELKKEEFILGEGNLKLDIDDINLKIHKRLLGLNDNDKKYSEEETWKKYLKYLMKEDKNNKKDIDGKKDSLKEQIIENMNHYTKFVYPESFQSKKEREQINDKNFYDDVEYSSTINENSSGNSSSGLNFNNYSKKKIDDSFKFLNKNKEVENNNKKVLGNSGSNENKKKRTLENPEPNENKKKKKKNDSDKVSKEKAKVKSLIKNKN